MARLYTQLSPDEPLEDNIAQINDAFRQISNEDRTKIVSDGSNSRVLTGYQKDGFGTGKDYGIKVSQEGYDVTTATNDQLVMSSAFNMFKIVDSGTLSLHKNASSSVATAQYYHNLGYVPAFLVYWTDAGGSAYGMLPYQYINLTSGIVNAEWHARSYVDNITITMWSPSAGSYYASTYDATFKYYLLRETAS